MTTEPTGSYETRDGQNVVVLTRAFSAPIIDVWAAIAEPRRLARWIGTWSGDPASGSVQFQMMAEGDGVPESELRIEACQPPHLLRVILDADWVIGIELTQSGEITALEFTQVIDDVSTLESVGPGWEFYLDRLVAAETQGDTSAIDFERDYYPALSAHYAALAARN